MSNDKITRAHLLARQGQWEAFLQLVNESSLDDWTRSHPHHPHDAAVQQQYMSTTPLHVALEYRPPVTVVHVTLIELRMPKFGGGICVPEEFPDEHGQTPLHVAVGAGCHLRVIERLLAGESLAMPAMLRDKQQRTALHVACFSSSSSSTAIISRPKTATFWGPNQMAADKWNKRQVIRLLLQQYPKAVVLKDKYGKTPLEYLRALQLSKASETEMERVQQLQRSSSSGFVMDADSLIDLLASKSNVESPINVPWMIRSPTRERIGRLEQSVSLITMEEDESDDIESNQHHNQQEKALERAAGVTTNIICGESHTTFDLFNVLGWPCQCFD